MRRAEFEVKDSARIEEVLRSSEVGYLAFHGPDGWPRITPLNFVYDGRILWHGAMGGERFECLRRNPKATFCAISLQAYLPSYFTSEDSAMGASVAFQSVIVRGFCEIIEGLNEKCTILNRLMEKYQPEGGYKIITPEEPLYQKVLKVTAIYALIPEQITGKFKLAQNKTEAERKRIISRLRERGAPMDLKVADAIQKALAE